MAAHNPLTTIPARSGVTAVLDAANQATEAVTNLQAFVADLRRACESRNALSVTEIRDLMTRHHI